MTICLTIWDLRCATCSCSPIPTSSVPPTTNSRQPTHERNCTTCSTSSQSGTRRLSLLATYTLGTTVKWGGCEVSDVGINERAQQPRPRRLSCKGACKQGRRCLLRAGAHELREEMIFYYSNQTKMNYEKVKVFDSCNVFHCLFCNVHGLQ